MKSYLLSFFLLSALISLAQINVGIKCADDQFIAHEDVMVKLTITNRAGKTIRLQAQNNLNWLDVIIRDSQGNVQVPLRMPAFKTATIPAGQTITKEINLSQFYDLTRFGRYRVNAIVRMKGQLRDGFSSNSDGFLITTGRVLFSQKIGVPRTETARQYEVMNFTGGDYEKLYVKITNNFNGRVIACRSMGKVILYENPNAALDGNNNLHVLYLITPTLYTHVSMSPTGAILKRQYHKRGAVGRPRLEAFGNGEVKVAGSVPFDPAKAKRERNKQRKLSDRPEY